MESTPSISPIQKDSANFFKKVNESKWLDISLFVSVCAAVAIANLATFDCFNSLMSSIQAEHLAIGMYSTAGVFAITVLVRPLFGLPVDGFWVAQPRSNHNISIIDELFGEPLSCSGQSLLPKEITSLKKAAKDYCNAHFPETTTSDTVSHVDYLSRKNFLSFCVHQIDSASFKVSPIDYMRSWQTRRQKSSINTNQLAWEFIYDELSKIREIPPDIIR